MGQDEQWRILAKEVAQEKDPEKLAEIIEALTRALDEYELQRSHVTRGARPTSGGERLHLPHFTVRYSSGDFFLK
jgi:hypothetical protein